MPVFSTDVELRVVTSDNAQQRDNLDLVRALHGGVMTASFSDLDDLALWERHLLTPDAIGSKGGAPQTPNPLLGVGQPASPLSAFSPPYAPVIAPDAAVVTAPTPLPPSSPLYPPPPHGIVFFAVVAVVYHSDDATGETRAEVCGGAACALYAATRIGVIEYLAVEPAWRCKGLTSQFTTLCASLFQGMSNAKLGAPLHCCAILVVEAADEHGLVDPDAPHNRGFDPAARQRVWTRLGFWPIETGFQMPGRFRQLCAQRHQLCILKPFDAQVAPGVAPLMVTTAAGGANSAVIPALSAGAAAGAPPSTSASASASAAFAIAGSASHQPTPQPHSLDTRGCGGAPIIMNGAAPPAVDAPAAGAAPGLSAAAAVAAPVQQHPVIGGVALGGPAAAGATAGATAVTAAAAVATAAGPAAAAPGVTPPSTLERSWTCAVPLSVLTDFVAAFYTAILAEEGVAGKEAAAEVRGCVDHIVKLHPMGAVKIGPSCWK